MKRPQHIGASIAAAVVATGLLAAPAFAAPGDEALIPEGTTGSLTIHKYEQQPAYGDDNYGMELPASATQGLVPLPGVTFQASRVIEADLHTNAGWQKAQEAVDAFDPFDPTASLANGGFGLVSPKSVVTGAAGTATFADLPVGLYLVEETATPPVLANQMITPAMPFLITVPLTNPTDLHEWIYDVHAYPKNVVSSVEKTVVDNPAFSLGDEIDWEIESSIPGGSVTTKYELADALDPKLEYRSTIVAIGGTPTSDFTATLGANNTVTVSLGATARQAAFDALQSNPAAKVLTVHTTVVKEAGEITNDATLTFQREGEPETEVLSDPAESKFGGINIFKHDREGNALEGAVFQVRAAHVNDFDAADVIDVDGTTEWTTNAQGQVAVDGLRYSAWADGAAVTEDSGKYNFYWLVETKAPAGFELLAGPIPFTIDSQVAQAITVDVVNTPHNAGGELPKTGAAGTVGIITAAVALIAGGGYLGLRAMRRDGTEA